MSVNEEGGTLIEMALHTDFEMERTWDGVGTREAFGSCRAA